MRPIATWNRCTCTITIHNAEFALVAPEQGSAFVPCIGVRLPDILCTQFEFTVGNDNCVSFEGRKLQIPASNARPNYVKTRVRVHRYVEFIDRQRLASSRAKAMRQGLSLRLAQPCSVAR